MGFYSNVSVIRWELYIPKQKDCRNFFFLNRAMPSGPTTLMEIKDAVIYYFT